MTAMHPDSGVPPEDARNSLPNAVEASVNCEELWYSTSRCQPRFDPAAANAMLAELINLINKGEVVYDCTRLDQIQYAVRYLIQRGIPRGGVLQGGPANYVLNLDPQCTRYNDYMTLTVIPATANSGPVMMAVDGLPNVPLLRNDHKELELNDLFANEPTEISFWHGAFHVMGLVRSQLEPHEDRFEVPGAYVWTCPNDITIARVHVYGAGASGGNGHATFCGGGGGSGAGYCRKKITVTPGKAYSILVGRGGQPNLSGGIATGEQGGDSTFGDGAAAILTATGGWAGAAGINPIPGEPSGGSGQGIGGDVNLWGAYGSSGASGDYAVGKFTGYGGLGGACGGPEGGVAGAMSTGTGGWGQGFGAGGSGGGSASNVAQNSPGGGGGDGGVIIYYFG